MAVLNTGLATPATGDFTIPYSCRFNGVDAYLNKTLDAAGNRKIWTYSLWVKRGSLGVYDSGRFYDLLHAYPGSGGEGVVKFHDSGYIGVEVDGIATSVKTDALYRDPSAWMHILVYCDAPNNDLYVYVNGVLASNTPTATDGDGYLNYDIPHEIGRDTRAPGTLTGDAFDGLMAEVHFIDGTAYDASDFGEFGDYGEWKPKEVSGLTYGTNGFYFDFSNASDFGEDFSGNNNDWTANNFGTEDQMLDSPTNNFATLNAIWKDSTVNLQEGNLRHNRTDNMNRPALSTLGMGTGKWYFEAWDSYTTGNQIGIQWEGTDVETYVHEAGTQAYTWNNPGATYANGVYDGGGNAGSLSASPNIRMVAYDGATGKLWGGVNGTWGASGDPAAGTNESMTVPAAYIDKMHGIVATENSSTSQGIIVNFGQDSSFAGNLTAQGNQDGNSIGDFYYTPPTGFLALCTSNLPEPAVIPSEHFNTVLWTGSSSEQAITGVGFQPDMVWIKCRNFAHWHQLFDAIRGVTKRIYPNETDAEATTAESLKSFDTDGYTMGTDGTGNHDSHSDTYVAWNWKANGSGSSNTNGTINTTATSANVDAGFSISTYTGDGNDSTIGHGLSKVPEMVIVKKRTTAAPGGARNWAVYHSSLATDKVLQLSTTSAILSEANFFREDLFSSSVFGCNGDYDTCYSGDTYVAYCFHSVDGYSKVGSWVGNGSTDGTFIYTGFRPAMIIWKVSTDVESWGIFDNVRDPDNRVGQRLHPESSSAESTASPTTGWQMDFTSNGFKWRGDTMAGNYDGETYIYLAFAETPFKYSNAR